MGFGSGCGSGFWGWRCGLGGKQCCPTDGNPDCSDKFEPQKASPTVLFTVIEGSGTGNSSTRDVRTGVTRQKGTKGLGILRLRSGQAPGLESYDRRHEGDNLKDGNARSEARGLRAMERRGWGRCTFCLCCPIGTYW